MVDGGMSMLTRTEIQNIFDGKCERMIVFVRHLEKCREFHYKTVWECKTGNILTRSSISAEEAIRLHEKKLNKLGLAMGQVKLMGGN